MSSNTDSNRIDVWNSGIQQQTSALNAVPLDVALDAFDNALNDVIETVETGGLDQLTPQQKVAVWHRVETVGTGSR